jgi:hypothetical protein
VGNPVSERVCTWGSTVVDCVTPAGTWSNGCYLKLLDPQPPFDNPGWEGHTDGYLVQCTVITTCTPAQVATGCLGTTSSIVTVRWVAVVPGTEPDPGDVAQIAIAQMNFHAGRIAMSPPAGPDTMTLVNWPTWMWITDPGENTTGPITRTATAGGVSVTATGTMDKIVWDLGDGHTVTCTTPGTAYRDGHSTGQSPDCGYIYPRSSANQPDLAYTLTATTCWTVTWAGAGQSGTIPLTFARTIAVRVGEVQTIVTYSGAPLDEPAQPTDPHGPP